MLTLRRLFGTEADILRDSSFQSLLLASLFPILGTSVVSPVLDSLIGPFGASPANIGLVISVFTAPGILVIPIAGMLADRFTRKRIIVWGLLTFGCAGSAIALTSDFRVVLLLRLVQGIGFAGIGPIVITSIGDTYTGDRETTGQGLRFTVSGLSGAAFSLVAGLLVGLAWQFPFLLYSLAIPAAVVVYLWFDEPTGTDAEVTPDGARQTSYLRALASLVSHPRVAALVAARGLMIVVWVGFLTYNSLIVVHLLDGAPSDAGFLAGMLNLTFAITGSQAGRVTMLVGSRYWLLVTANLGMGGGLTFVLIAPSVPVAALGIAMAGAGLGITGTLYRSILTDLAPTHLRAGLISLSESGGRITVTLTPLLMGVALAHLTPAVGFPTALRLTGLGTALAGGGGGIAFLLIARLSSPVATDGEVR